MDGISLGRMVVIMRHEDKIFGHIPDDKEDSSAPWDDLVKEDFHVAVYKDKYPVSLGHLLFVPKYNSIGILTQAFEDAVRTGIGMVKSGKIDGFNIGLNYGKTAGQTVDWPHVHLIPRFEGDVKDPIGGIRGVIPGKANYRKTEK